MWSPAVTVAGPAAEPVTLAQAKQFLSVEDNSQDALLGGFIAAAREQVEQITGSRFAAQTVELLADDWSDLLRLPLGGVASVASIAYQDRDGAVQLVATSVYELTGAGMVRGIRTKVGQGWPDDVRAARGAITVRVEAGAAKAPGPVETAILLMVGDQFAFRESGVVGTVAAEIKTSMSVMALLSNYRVWL